MHPCRNGSTVGCVLTFAAGPSASALLPARDAAAPPAHQPGSFRVTARDAWRAGFLEAFATPAWVLGVGYIGFGSLAQSQGFSIVHAALSTLAVWALPG